MNWLFINRILDILGPKTRIGYLVTAPALLGILKIVQHSRSLGDVELGITGALLYGLTLSFAGVLVLRDVFCPELIKSARSEEQYLQNYYLNRTDLLDALSKYREKAFTQAKQFSERKKELLIEDVKPDLLTVLPKAEAIAIAEALADRMHPLSKYVEVWGQDLLVESREISPPGVATLYSQNRFYLYVALLLLSLGALFALGALLFIIVPILNSILHALRSSL